MPHDPESHAGRARVWHAVVSDTAPPAASGPAAASTPPEAQVGADAPHAPAAAGARARRDADRSVRVDVHVDAHLTRLDDALRAAAARFYGGDATPDPALHAAVCAAVDAIRADGADILTTLRVVKGRLAAARPQGPRDDVVRWCIARYYDPASRPAPTARPTVGGV